MTTPIPSPPSIPFLGHATAIDKELPLRSFLLMAEQYGDIYQLNILSRRVVVLNSYELLNDVCDEKKFLKNLPGPLVEVRNALGDGLFTAYPDEPNWGPAHRLLMPAFGTAAIRNMFDDMVDIASQLVLKWDRFGPAYKIDPADDFTRLTLDTIALCSMSFRLNSFYRENNHDFVQAMVDVLIESNLRANRPGVLTSIMRNSKAKYEQDIKTMADLADNIIAERKKNPTEHKDLLNTMLYGKDPKTGQGLSDENIRNNLLTFLVAGHETTSGTLTFALYYIMKSPEVMRKLREEVDEILGDQPIQLADLSKLPYCIAIIRETLRLRVPAAMRTVTPKEDTTIGGGKYLIEKGVTVVSNSWKIQRDTRVWGEDADEFKPERMMDGKFEAVPPNAWQPFGFGMRACIGRAFALQEAQIALACVIQKFDFVMDDPSYELILKQTMTLKPTGFYVHAIPRSDRTQLFTSPSAAPLRKQETKKAQNTATPSILIGSQSGHPMYVLYGSNTGTSESFAQRIAGGAAAHGFQATMGTLDSVVNRMPSDGPVIIVTASFEGEPADNAAHFVDWLVNLKTQEFANLRFALFGCGNRDWARTFQRIPKLCDQLLEERGGRRLAPRGEGDASASDFFETFDNWEANLWEVLQKEYNTSAVDGIASGVGIEVTKIDTGTARASALRQSDAALGTVLENKVLTAPDAPAKRHFEFELPDNMTYRAGDYLAILPLNPPHYVHRAIARFDLSPEQQVTLSSAGPTPLPIDQPISVFNLLSGYVELAQPATTRDIQILSQNESNAETIESLQSLSASYVDSVLAKRLSVLDILEDYPDIKLPLGTFLSMLPSMRIRQYSISSSPLWNPQRASLTVSILDAPAISGRTEPFLGVASTYLASLRAGEKVQVAVRSSSVAFHPPQDPSVPIVMFCAGTGLAPMRGFIQERALQKKAGRDIGKTLLFFGCRRPTEDYLYSDSDLKAWMEAGVVDVRPAFSRSTEDSLGCKYVQDRVWHDREDISAAYGAGAKFFTCGSRKVATGIKETLTAIIKEKGGLDDTQAAALFDATARYATDIFE